jgi:glycosyltransferase involved in cell wall biosynthesis
MTIVILGDSFTFPEGNAATNHAYTYAKGFMQRGICVHVICFKTTYSSFSSGISEGIKFYIPFGQSRRSSFFIVRRWQSVLKYFRTYRLIKEINRTDKILAINLWSYIFLNQLFAFLLAKRLKTKLILERSEHPLRYYNPDSPLQQFYGNCKIKLEIKLYDGIFCISNYLIQYYKSKGFPPDKLFLVPSTVDTGRFNVEFTARLPFNSIVYCGTLNIQKDGVDILIESFNKISAKYPDIKLVLIGKGESFNNEEAILRELVHKLELDDKVFFLGQLPRSLVPEYLSSAKILALSRPTSIIADAGFPSKLTEYLATGKPVVVTRVGEIPQYLTDNVNAFLAEPDSVDAFANKLDYVISNYQLAVQVSQRGKDLTKTVFNYNYQAGRMLEFIHSLWQA